MVVVGGGLAGLSAALTLADAGASVTLLESRSRLGGATWSFNRRGLWFDNGQHVFLRCCTAYRVFLERIGAAGSVVLQERLELPVLAPATNVAWLRRNRLPAPLHLAGSLTRYEHLSLGDRLRLGRALLPLRRADLADPSLDQQTFADFLRSHGQRTAAVEKLWDLICVPTVNLPAAEASLTLAATVFQLGLLTDAAAGDIGWSRVPLAHLHAEPAAAALERAGADVRMSTPVETVESDSGGVVVATATDRINADAVIVAVPHEVAAPLLPGVAGSDRWTELGTSPIVNIHLVYDRKVLHHEFAAVVDSPLQFLFDRTGTSGLGDRAASVPGHLAVRRDAVDLGAVGRCRGDGRARARPAVPGRCLGASARCRRDPRTSGDVPRRPRQPGAPAGGAYRRAGRLSRRSVDCHRLAGDDGGRRAQRRDRRQRRHRRPRIHRNPPYSGGGGLSDRSWRSPATQTSTAFPGHAGRGGRSLAGARSLASRRPGAHSLARGGGA